MRREPLTDLELKQQCFRVFKLMHRYRMDSEDEKEAGLEGEEARKAGAEKR